MWLAPAAVPLAWLTSPPSRERENYGGHMVTWPPCPRKWHFREPGV